jgi:hypothetical protein
MELDPKNKRWRFTPGGLAVPEGLGSPGTPGLGDPPTIDGGCCGDDPQVWRLIQSGSPRLALARASGQPLVPLIVSIRATFPSTSTTDVPAVGMQGNQGGTPYRLVQDALIQSMVYIIQNESETANQNIFQAQSDSFYGQQSGIEAILSIEGQPRYVVVGQYTPLKNIADFFNGSAQWPYGWIIKPSQQLLMSFHADISLPTAPIEVIVSFRLWTTVSDGDIPSNRQAFEHLCDLGYQVPNAVVNQLCR